MSELNPEKNVPGAVDGDKDDADDRKRPANPPVEVLSGPNKIIKTDAISMQTFLLNPDFMCSFQSAWSNEHPLTESSVTLHKDPFQICIIKDFLAESNVIECLVDEMTKMHWTRQQMDLYNFYRTADLSNVSLPFLQSFYMHMNTNVLPWISKITNLTLTHISGSCSMYNQSDHLLVHDDMVSDRRIAYVYYVSPWNGVTEWSEQMGGCLELFNIGTHNQPEFPVCQRIPPANNQFVFFKVTPKSFHQVGEVTQFDYPRLTINGWFHGPADTDMVSEMRFDSIDQYRPPNDEEIDLSEWINEIYLKDKLKTEIHQYIESTSEVSLNAFLSKDVYDVMTMDLLTNPDHKWEQRGPANQRNYETLSLNSLRGPIRDLVNVFQSPAMFNLLLQYTELDLAGNKATSPACSIEMQRWKPGYYTVLNDAVVARSDSLDLIMYFNAHDHVGVVTFLSTGDSDNEQEPEDSSVLLTIRPRDNILNIVYRSNDVTRFTKYVSKNIKMSKDFVYMLTCSYKE